MSKPLLALFALALLAASNIFAQVNLYPVRVADKWGYIDTLGNIKIAAKYQHAHAFERNGLALVQRGKLVGVIDTSGRELLPCAYDFADTFNLDERLFIVREKNVWQLRDADNRLIVNNISGEAGFKNFKFIQIHNEDGVGLVHMTRGEVVRPDTQFVNFTPISAELVQSHTKSGLVGLIHRDSGQILAPEYIEIKIDGPIIFARNKHKWAIFNAQGAQCSDFKFDACYFLLDNFALTRSGDGCIIYNYTKKEVAYTNIDTAMTLYRPRPAIRIYKNELVGLLNNEAQELLPAKYQNIESWFDFLLVREDNKYGLFDSLAQPLLTTNYKSITVADTSLLLKIQAPDSERWGLYNIPKNTIVCEPKYKSIQTFEYSIAIADLEEEFYTIINRNGGVALNVAKKDSIYDLALNNNILSFRTKTGGKKIVPFDDEGRAQEATEYTKYNRLRVRPNNNPTPNPNNTAPRPTPSMRINDTYYWTLYTKNEKWGIRDTIENKWKVPPIYNRIERHPEYGFTLVFKNNSIDLDILFDKITYKYTQACGIFNDSMTVLAGKVEFISINLQDFAEGRGVARCIFTNGLHGLVARNGKIVARDYVFLGKIHEGSVRVAVSGTLSAHFPPQKNLVPIVSISQYTGYMNVSTTDVSGYASNEYMQRMRENGQVHCADCRWGIIDTLGRVILKPQYQFIDDFHKGSASYLHQNQWGLLDRNGNPLIQPSFADMQYLPNSNKELYIINRPDYKVGLIDSNANLVIPMQYHRIRDPQEGLAAVCLDSRWGFVSIQTKDTIVGCHFNAVRDFKEGLAAVVERGRWGFINSAGHFAIKADFAQCGDFSEGKAWVRLKAGKMGYIDQQGNLVIDGDFAKLTDFQNGVAVAADKSYEWGIIDAQGQWLCKPSKKFDAIEIIPQKGLAIAKIGDKKALINYKGDILSPHCAVIRPFSEGLAVVRKNPLSDNPFKNSDWGYIDTTGQLVGRFEYHQLGDFYNGRAKFYDPDSHKWGYISPDGKVAIPPTYQTARDFDEARAVILLGYNQAGLIDTSGKYIMLPKHNQIIDNHQGICLIRNSYSNYHFLSEDLRRLTAQSFTQAHPFLNGVAPVKHGSAWGLLNAQGLFTLSPKYQNMHPVHEGHARVELLARIGVANTDGKIIIPAEYEYIQYMGNNIFRVENGNTVEYLDSKGRFLWKEQTK